MPGTLAYIAPERLAGEQATGAADVWAVGVILWEALAGYQPFWSGSPVETARLIAEGPPPLAKLRPDLPRALAAARRPRGRRRPAPAAGARSASPPSSGRVSRSASSAGGAAPPCPARALRRARAACRADRRVRRVACRRCFRSTRPARRCRSRPSRRLAASPRRVRASRSRSRSPLLPLGDVSLGLAAVYAVAALGWLALFWNDARRGLLFVAGPLLALGRTAPARGARSGPGRRSVPAGVRRRERPCWPRPSSPAFAGLRFRSRGEQPPLGLGIAGTRQPGGGRGGPRGGRSPRSRPSASRPRCWRATAALPLPLLRRSGLGRHRRCSRARCRRDAARPARARRRRRGGARSLLGGVAALAAAVRGTRRCSRGCVAGPGRLAPTMTRLGLFRGIENRIESLFEGVFGRAFRSHVQPVELARKLAKEMDDHKTVSVSRVYVPNEYVLYLSQRDRAQFRGLRAVAARRAGGLPRGARPPRGLLARVAPSRPPRGGRRPRRRGVRHRDQARAGAAPAGGAFRRPPRPPGRPPRLRRRCPCASPAVSPVVPPPASPPPAPVPDDGGQTRVYEPEEPPPVPACRLRRPSRCSSSAAASGTRSAAPSP